MHHAIIHHGVIRSPCSPVRPAPRVQQLRTPHGLGAVARVTVDAPHRPTGAYAERFTRQRGSSTGRATGSHADRAYCRRSWRRSVGAEACPTGFSWCRELADRNRPNVWPQTRARRR